MTISAKSRQALRLAIRPGFANEIVNAIDNATSDPVGIQRKKVAGMVSLKDLGTKYVKFTTMYAGWVIRYVGINIVSTVVAGGTTAAIGLGQHGGDEDAYGLSADLATDSGFANIIPESVLAVDTDIDICGVVADGSALGDTNISDGIVFISIVWDQPAVVGG